MSASGRVFKKAVYEQACRHRPYQSFFLSCFHDVGVSIVFVVAASRY